MGFKKYFELISYLLVAEQHNDLLMKSHKSRPPSTAPFLEVNAANFYQTRHEKALAPVVTVVVVVIVAEVVINILIKQQQCKRTGEAGDVVSRTNYENKCYRCRENEY